jgi:hypothetical protein
MPIKFRNMREEKAWDMYVCALVGGNWKCTRQTAMPIADEMILIRRERQPEENENEED